MNIVDFYCTSPAQTRAMNKKLRLMCAGLITIVLLFANAVWASSDHDAKAHDEQHGDHHEEQHEEHTEKVELTAEQLKTLGITLEKTQSALVHERLAVYGRIVLNAEKTQRVTARFKGVVRSLNKKVGERVRAGEVLASIESDESLKTYTLNSALDGVVLERALNLGEQTDDKSAFVIADVSSLWVEIDLFPTDFARVRKGQTVRVINPHTGTSAEGEINYLSMNTNKLNQAATGRILLANTEQQWLPGLFVQAEVLIAAQPVAIAVRNSALQEHEGKPVIFVQGLSGFEPRPVRIGRSDGIWTEMLAGVTNGETYAADNSFIIKAELGKDGAAHDH